MERLDFLFSETKSIDEGVVEGFASTFLNTDRHGERIMPGAFTKTLLENGNKIPLLWQHKTDDPIGLASVYGREKGIAVTAKLDMDVEAGRRAFSAVKKGIVRAFSIGFDTIKSRKGSDGVRELTELRLWEVSLVTFPANPEAVVTGAKAAVDAVILTGFRDLIVNAARLARTSIDGADLARRERRLLDDIRSLGESAHLYAKR